LRIRTLGALSALAVLVAIVAVVPAATGADGSTETYVVQLVQAPVAGYTGGVAGYPATKPGKGKKLDATSADARKYAALLTDKHNKALQQVGARQQDLRLHRRFQRVRREADPGAGGQARRL
jgi:hypothetical protein